MIPTFLSLSEAHRETAPVAQGDRLTYALAGWDVPAPWDREPALPPEERRVVCLVMGWDPAAETRSAARFHSYAARRVFRAMRHDGWRDADGSYDEFRRRMNAELHNLWLAHERRVQALYHVRTRRDAGWPRPVGDLSLRPRRSPARQRGGRRRRLRATAKPPRPDDDPDDVDPPGRGRPEGAP